MKNLPELELLVLFEDVGRLKMLEKELVILFRLVSPRRNGSYEELAVNCGGVVADILAVDV